jgi:hypothetical protein
MRAAPLSESAMKPTRIFWDARTHPDDPCWVAESGDVQFELEGDVGSDPDAADSALIGRAMKYGLRAPFHVDRSAVDDELAGPCRPRLNRQS